MSKIILIETSTALCSVAIAIDGVIAGSRESNKPKAHASLTAVFVKELLDEQGLFVKDCDAVCVSAGPGSYTGLRVGASTAKGLCFGADIKLLSVPTTDVLVAQALSEKLLPEGCKYIVPMIDARRMEVYSALYDAKGKRLTETKAEIIDENSYSSQIQEGPVLFIGDGAAKCSDIIKSDSVSFVQTCPHAGAMLKPACEAFKREEWQNCAYFEPFYLKQYIATISNKKLF